MRCLYIDTRRDHSKGFVQLMEPGKVVVVVERADAKSDQYQSKVIEWSS
jgi:hypothetical protein